LDELNPEKSPKLLSEDEVSLFNPALTDEAYTVHGKLPDHLPIDKFASLPVTSSSVYVPSTTAPNELNPLCVIVQ
jgi:hypothetical protein